MWILIIVGLSLVAAAFFLYRKAPVSKGDVLRNLSYNDKQTLDFYAPTKQVFQKTPVVIFYHGGAWIVGRKETLNFTRYNRAINTLRERGYAVVSPNYTLARNGNSPFPGCIMDTYDALKWVENNAEQYQLDTKNVGVFGESAGAHLAMVAGYIPPEKFDAPPHQLQINYVVDIYGPNNLNDLYHMQTMDSLNKLLSKMPESLHHCLDLSRRLFGFDPEEDPQKARKFMDHFSPIHYVDRGAPPTLLIHGTKDQIVPVDQSTNLQLKLDSLGVKHEIHLLEGSNHAFIGASMEQRGQVQDWIVAFVEEHYEEVQKD